MGTVFLFFFPFPGKVSGSWQEVLRCTHCGCMCFVVLVFLPWKNKFGMLIIVGNAFHEFFVISSFPEANLFVFHVQEESFLPCWREKACSWKMQPGMCGYACPMALHRTCNGSLFHLPLAIQPSVMQSFSSLTFIYLKAFPE